MAKKNYPSKLKKHYIYKTKHYNKLADFNAERAFGIRLVKIMFLEKCKLLYKEDERYKTIKEDDFEVTFVNVLSLYGIVKMKKYSFIPEKEFEIQIPSLYSRKAQELKFK